MHPIKIKKISNKSLEILWDDDHISNYSLKRFRDKCPCANCQGETVLFNTYKPEKKEIEHPDKYILKNIQPVGNYAISVIWGDGHDSGIYSWEYLRKICECDKCIGK